jgi:hypothetical protein
VSDEQIRAAPATRASAREQPLLAVTAAVTVFQSTFIHQHLDDDATMTR